MAYKKSSPSAFAKNTFNFMLLAVKSILIIANTKSAVAQTSDIGALKNRVANAVKGLNEGALRGYGDTVDSMSYQSKAIQRLSEQTGVDGFSDVKLVQYYALYCIYFATNAVPNEITNADPRFQNIVMPEWYIATNWRDTTMVDPCGTSLITPTNSSFSSIATTLSMKSTGGWHGITCDNEGRVIAIELFENFLTGTFPEEIVLLASDGPFSTGAGSLESLDLFDNEFLSNGGDSTWMTDLGGNITTIIVETTGFSGDIPLLPENLVNLNIANAFYSGGFVDDNFLFATQLNYLNLDGNLLNSTIPETLSELPNLEYVYASDNFLSGDLSPLEGSQSIIELWVDGNPDLSGPLFSWLGNITTLASLSLAYNNLTGTIPTEIGNLSEMQQMWLHFNNLVGTIPTELGKMTQLRHLELEENAFTGFVHASICERTEFPLQVLKTLGADCFDENFFCPCCTCCNLEECVTGMQRVPPSI